MDERHGSDSSEEMGKPKWRPQRGWAVPIPATTPRAYVGGDAALNMPINVPKLAEDADRGDWHEWGTWWSPTPTEPDETALKIERWGPDGENAGAPGPPELRDARAAMTAIAHPSAENAEPIYAATVRTGGARPRMGHTDARTRAAGPARDMTVAERRGRNASPRAGARGGAVTRGTKRCASAGGRGSAQRWWATTRSTTWVRDYPRTLGPGQK